MTASITAKRLRARAFDFAHDRAARVPSRRVRSLLMRSLLSCIPSVPEELAEEAGEVGFCTYCWAWFDADSQHGFLDKMAAS